MSSLWNISCLIALFYSTTVTPDPQINLLSSSCGEYRIANRAIFLENLNRTFSDLRSQLSVNGTRFATSQNARQSDPVCDEAGCRNYMTRSVRGVVQCRNYMTTSDCLQCFTAAEDRIRNCSNGEGARVIYDGCIVRYEPSDLFQEATNNDNQGICGTKPISQETTSIVDHLLLDLAVAAPRMDEYFAASIRQVKGGINIYAIAQCINIISKDECKQCLNVAYNNLMPCKMVSEGRAVDIRCFLRFSDDAFFINNQTTDIVSFLSDGKLSKKGAIIGGVVGGFGICLVFTMVAILCLRNISRKRKGDISGAAELRDIMNYKYQDLKSATNNFSNENKLGEGGFGDVYKAILKDGNVVAVKRLAITQVLKAKEHFESEVKLISNVYHRNLIRLLGGCSKRKELFLVYEYMKNSSLDKFLFGDKMGTLDWKQRIDIIVGIAKGLVYLHEECTICIIHRDIKSSNILLDDDYQPKIADFGLARLLPDARSHVNTKFAGTMGYMAPEYVIHGYLSPKVDTYSYGVLVLEIISGRKSNDMKLEPAAQYLVEWAWGLYKEDTILDLVDKRMNVNQYDMVEVRKVIGIALLCTQSLVDSRPTMSDVLLRLS